MTMHRLSFDSVKCELYEEVMSCGLRLVVCPLKNAKEVYAGIHVETGAYRHEEAIDKVKMPQGVAHFLEHMLFYTPGGPAHKLFNDLHADVNAYTSEGATVFYFSTTENYVKPLNLLLTMVTNLSFRETDVENEKTVILNELDEDNSSPLVQADNEIRRNLYNSSPLKDAILGSSEEIKTIHLSTLKKYFTEKYLLKKMTLFITGNVRPEDVHNMLNSAKFTNVVSAMSNDEYVNKEEYGQANIPESEISEAYSTEMVSFGIKFLPRQELFERYGDDLFAIYEILDDIILGESNKYIDTLKSSGFISSIASSNLEEGGEDAYYSATILTAKPAELIALLKEYLYNLNRNIPTVDYDYTIKENYGNGVRNLGSSADCFFNLLQAYENHVAYPALIERAAYISPRIIKKFLKDMQTWSTTFVTVHKKGDTL